jgi:hypothetical protein
MKICSKCGQPKEATLVYFHRDKYSNDGLYSICKGCKNKTSFNWRINNPSKNQAAQDIWRAAHPGYSNNWRLSHPERMKELTKKWELKHPEKRSVITAKYREANMEKIKTATKKWRTNNPEVVRAIEKRRGTKRRSSLKYRLRQSISGGISHSLHGAKNKQTWESLVKFTIDQLKCHLEKLFKPGMTWENYGTVWEIDHKIPIAVFNFEKPEDIDFRICWSLKNLQPLECSKNRSKRATLEKPFQPSLCIGG